MNLREILDVQMVLERVSELRMVESPAGFPLGSLSKRYVCKGVRRLERVTPTPSFTEREFNAFLMISPRSRAPPGYLHWLMSSSHHIVLTHADLHPGNIIVHRTAGTEITIGTNDWELDGFYPEYCKRDIGNTSDW